MRHLHLAKIRTGVAQADVFTIKFIGIVEIPFSLDIISFCFGKQVGILQMTNIRGHCVHGTDVSILALQDVGDIGRIRQRTDGGAEEIDDVPQKCGMLDFLPFQNVIEINRFE